VESRRAARRLSEMVRFIGVTIALCSLVVAPAAAQDDPLSPIAELVRRRADDRALEALDHLPAAARATPRARYLRGRLLQRRSEMAAAAAAYPTGDDASALPDEVRRDSERRAGLAHARAGDCARARSILSAHATHAPSQAAAAECALALGDLDAAVSELRAVVARGDAAVDLFAARFGYAEALERAGQRDEAVEVLTSLVVERPAHPEIARAEAALRALNGAPIELSFAQQIRRIEQLMDAHRYRESLAALDELGRPRSRAEQRVWVHLRGMTLYRLRRRWYAEAATTLFESERLGGAHSVEDQFHAARALSRSDQDAAAVREYRRFAREHSTHRLAPEAMYLAAWLELRHSMPGGMRNMARFVRSRYARRSDRFRQEGTWQLGLRAFEAGRYRAAERHLERYAGMSPSPMVRGRGWYWVGRARQEAGDRDGALEAYREALYVEPLHWYALLARQRIEALGEPSPPPFPEPAEPGAAETVRVELPDAARFYASLGLRHEALDALRARERRMRRGRDGLRRVVAAYRALGEAGRPARLVGGPATLRRRSAPGPVDRWRWDGAFPRPFAQEVDAAAEAGGLTPAHMYAVMRQESGFDPDVVSYADAIGLMQLLPDTAIPMARRVGLEVTREMLFDPEINTRIGAAYVGGLMSRFGMPLGFAAFNGGGHNVDRWLERSGRQELDLFVEHIPFNQTRNYIRRVTTHFAHYRYLDDPSRGWPITLPTHVEPRGD